MLKATYEAVSIAIPRKELVDAAKKFLLRSESNKDLVLVDNIDSPNFGSSDLLFINKAKTNLTVARLNDREDCERFIILSISYYFWLKESIRVSNIFSNRETGLDMYLFSHDFSAAIHYLMDNLAKRLKVYLIKYNSFEVEDLDEPAIYFQHMTLEELVQDKLVEKDRRKEEPLLTEEKGTPDPLEISAQELSEFNRLKERYLT